MSIYRAEIKYPYNFQNGDSLKFLMSNISTTAKKFKVHILTFIFEQKTKMLQ